ncbi:epimerase [Paraburkholderia hospita]|uniref:Epimerase n=1 Tax=Paraburkholderia hospita TaxID=169430 RepID=A0ABP2PXY4_9BURK|nr:PhzF family phenazine biosynthesis protein [Paraburkholderia hospita]EIN02196.1 epimerase [Paraburkholderia hospita]OUL90156.1 hypothetical protein CA602_07300 [Paraburkholderia hospita]
MKKCEFHVVDVFAVDAFKGNPVMIVVPNDVLDDRRMQAFSSWNGMPETVFLTRGTDLDEGDYSVRIFSPRGELGFAGHPSLGAAHVVVERGWVTSPTYAPADARFGDGACSAMTLAQRCKVGMVETRVLRSQDGGVRAFVKTPAAGEVYALPGQVAHDVSVRLSSAPDARAYQVRAGANWIVVKLPDPTALQALVPDLQAIEEMSLSLSVSGITAYAPIPNHPTDLFEVRSFGPAIGVPEDAICGGGNACVAVLETYLAESPRTTCGGYQTRQGRFIGRDGRAQLVGPVEGGRYWVGGTTKTVMQGSVSL